MTLELEVKFNIGDNVRVIHPHADGYSSMEADSFEAYVTGYAIHIKNLKIFDTPKNIVHYGTNAYYDDEGRAETNMLWKAPGRIIKVYDDKWNPYFFFPMQSQEMCRVLNGEQTVIIKNKVLKGML